MKWTPEMTQKAIEQSKREEKFIDDIFTDFFTAGDLSGKEVHIPESDIIKKIRLWSPVKIHGLVLALLDAATVYHWLDWFTSQLTLGLWEKELKDDPEYRQALGELLAAFEKTEDTYMQGLARERAKEAEDLRP